MCRVVFLFVLCFIPVRFALRATAAVCILLPVGHTLVRGSSSSCACTFSIIKAYYDGGKVNKMTSIVNGGDFRVALHGIYARGVGTTLRSEIAHFLDADFFAVSGRAEGFSKHKMHSLGCLNIQRRASEERILYLRPSRS